MLDGLECKEWHSKGSGGSGDPEMPDSKNIENVTALQRDRPEIGPGPDVPVLPRAGVRSKAHQ